MSDTPVSAVASPFPPRDDMPADADSGGRDVKANMVVIAERMFGELGLDGVSMRDVATAAGQRNNSAVQYHFGSREGLVTAVLRRRMTAIDSERIARLRQADAAGLGSDLPTLVRVLLEPFVDMIRQNPQPTHYCRFLAQTGPVIGPTIPETELRTATDDIVVRLIEVLDHLPRRTAFERIDLTMQMFIGALAVHEDRQHADEPVEIADFEKTVTHLYDMTLAGLRTRASTGQEG